MVDHIPKIKDGIHCAGTVNLPDPGYNKQPVEWATGHVAVYPQPTDWDCILAAMEEGAENVLIDGRTYTRMHRFADGGTIEGPVRPILSAETTIAADKDRQILEKVASQFDVFPTAEELSTGTAAFNVRLAEDGTPIVDRVDLIRGED